VLDEDQLVLAVDQIMPEDISFIAIEPKKARYKHHYSTIYESIRNLKCDYSFQFPVFFLLMY